MSKGRSTHGFNGEAEAEGGDPAIQVLQHSGLGHDLIWIGEDLMRLVLTLDQDAVLEPRSRADKGDELWPR